MVVLVLLWQGCRVWVDAVEGTRRHRAKKRV